MQQEWIIAIAIAYVLGATPFGLLIGFTKGVDIRKSGSGNIGATNTGRILGKKWGIACFILDVLKGALPVFAAGWYMGLVSGEVTPDAKTAALWFAVGIGAFFGHLFPFWLKFKGGKGVATGFGVLLGLFPYLTWCALVGLLVWVVSVKICRYVSLSSMLAAIVMPLLFVGFSLWLKWDLTQLWPLLVALGLLAILIVVKHRSNIGRLLRGEESKIGEKNAEKEDAVK